MTDTPHRRRSNRRYGVAQWRRALVGGSIFAGAALWLAALVNLVRHAS